jgi:hypothetical protein
LRRIDGLTIPPVQHVAYDHNTRPAPAPSPLLQDARTRLTYQLLERDLPKLPHDLRQLVTAIIQGSTEIQQPPCDIYVQESGLKWWMVKADRTKQRFFEAFLFCIKRKRYFKLTPFDVQEMVDAIKTGSEGVKRRAAQVTAKRRPSEQEAMRKEFEGAVCINRMTTLTPRAAQGAQELLEEIARRRSVEDKKTATPKSQTSAPLLVRGPRETTVADLEYSDGEGTEADTIKYTITQPPEGPR